MRQHSGYAMKSAPASEPEQGGSGEGRPMFGLLVDSFETIATHGCGLLIGIPMLGITAHWLGPRGRGVYVTTITWAGLAATLSGFSLGLVAIHEMARSENQDVGALLGTLMAFAAGETCIAWCVLFFAHWFDTRLFGEVNGAALILGISSIPFLILKDYLGAVLIARSRVPLWNRAQLAGTALSFLLVGGLAATALISVEGVIIAWLFGQVLVCLVAFLNLYRRVQHWTFRPALARSLLSGGSKLHINALGSMAVSSIDVLMVNAYVGAAEVGYYQLALKLTTTIGIIAQAVGTVTYGRVVELGADGSWWLIRQLCVLTMGAMIVAGILGAWFAPRIVDIIAGPHFSASITLFRVMLLAIPGLAIAHLMNPQWICRGYFWQAGSLTLSVASVNALANWVLVPRYGALGAAFSFISVYMISMVVNGGMAAFCESRWRSLGAPAIVGSAVNVSVGSGSAR